jgi:hypothetical protein
MWSSLHGNATVLRSHNIPNHPTAVFPDAARVSTARELYPRANQHFLHSGDRKNRSKAMLGYTARAMPPGPIGVAVNGVVFFDPYDAEAVEAFGDSIAAAYRAHAAVPLPQVPVCGSRPGPTTARHSPLSAAFDGYPVRTVRIEGTMKGCD